MWALAIDFGTSRSAGAMYADGAITPLEVEGNRWMSSLVLLDPSGEVLVGTAADNQAGVYPDRVERTPKRHLGSRAPLVLGEGTLDPVDAAAAVIRVFLLHEGRLRRNGEDPSEVVVTHPVRWADERKRALVDAVMRAGLPEPTLVDEPVAAAVHYVSDQVAVGQHVAIYDLGGGTFDTAVLRRTDSGFETIGIPGGDEFIGGEDFDHRLFRYFGECLAADDAQLWDDLCTSDERKFRRAALDLIVQARRAKEALSAWTSTQVFVPIADRDIVVNRSQFEAMIIDDIERTVDLMDDTVASAGIAADDLAALYLVGGSSRIPLIVQMLTDRFGDRVTTRDEPKSVVALGAAKIAGALLAEHDAGASASPVAADAPAPIAPAEANVAPTQLESTAPAPVAAPPMRAASPSDTFARVAPAFRRWGDRVGERAKGVIQALGSAPVVGGTAAVPVGAVPLLPAATADLRMADVRWRVQFTRLTGQLATDGHVVLFGTDAGEFQAIDAVSGASRWVVQIDTPVTHEPMVHGSVALVGGGDGTVRAFDIATGRVYWTVGLGSPITAPIVASGEHLMVALGGGSVVGLDRASGAGRWRVDTGGLPCATALVSASTALVATDAGRLVHLDLGHGTTIWHTQLRGRVSGVPAIAHDLTLVPSADGVLHGLDIATGGVRWSVATGGGLVGPVAVDESHAYVASADGCVYAIDVPSGVARWRHAVAGPYSAGPVVASGALHVDTGNGELQVIDLATFATRWRVGTGPYNRCRPVRAGAMVVIGTPHAQLYGLFDQV